MKDSNLQIEIKIVFLQKADAWASIIVPRHNMLPYNLVNSG